MVKVVKLMRLGGSIGMSLPKEIAEALRVKAGDTLHVVMTEQGVLLTPYDPAFATEVAAYRRVAKKHRDVFRELSKR
jgi:putative addiction module antidote